MPGFRSFFEVDLDQETAKTILSPAASFTTFGVVLFVAGYFTQKSETQLSALRKGHDKMVASDTLKKRLLVNLSHELRTPLHAVHGYAGLLQDDFAKLPPEILSQARSYPHQILKSCQSLRCILDNMFQFVKSNPVETHVLVQARNTGETESKVFAHSTSTPNTGTFTPTALHTDA